MTRLFRNKWLQQNATRTVADVTVALSSCCVASLTVSPELSESLSVLQSRPVRLV